MCSLVFTQMSWKLLSTLKPAQMFIAAYFVIANTWKQQRGPSVAGKINKLWYIQTMEDYSALKRNEVSSHGKTVRKPECKFLTKRSQPEKVIHPVIAAIWCSGEKKLWNSKMVRDCQGLVGERDEEAVCVGFMGQWKCSVQHHNDRYVSLFICPNPQSYGEWALGPVAVCGCSWCVSVHSSVTTQAPLGGQGSFDNGGGFPGGASGKEATCQCRRRKSQGLIPELGRSLEEGVATHSSILA